MPRNTEIQTTSLTSPIDDSDPTQIFHFDTLKEQYEDDINTEIAARFGSVALESDALSLAAETPTDNDPTQS